jgi:TonB family protein
MRLRTTAALAVLATMATNSAPMAKVVRQTPSKAARKAELDSVTILADQLRSEFHRHATDKFFDLPSHDQSKGKPFNLTVHGVAEYEDGELTASFTNMNGEREGFQDFDHSIQFRNRIILKGAYIGENGFGVRRRVTVTTRMRDMLDPKSYPAGDWLYTEKTTGAEARQRVQRIVGVIEGRISDGTEPAGECSSNRDGATIDEPIDETLENCSINVDVDRLAFVDSDTGKIYAEWTEKKRVELKNQSVPSQSDVIENPSWLHRPSGDDIVQYYPPRAMDLGREGFSSIKCIVTASGSVENCTIVSETPDGYGFGAAALRLSALFKMKMTAPDGQPVQGKSVVIPISWKLAG